jgi:hypothetical protein
LVCVKGGLEKLLGGEDRVGAGPDQNLGNPVDRALELTTFDLWDDHMHCRPRLSSSASPAWLSSRPPDAGALPAGVSSRGLLSGHFYFLRRDPLLDVRPPEAPIRAETKCGDFAIL